MSQERITPIILAGGTGTRLWPLSRQDMPKQFCSIEGGKSLFQKTLARVDNDELFNPAIIICSKNHQSIVSTQLLSCDKQVQMTVLEPEGRDTAAAIALGVQLTGNNADDHFLVMPSDHEIEDIDGFHKTIKQAQPIVINHDRIVTLGIQPEYPETGFGYIRAGQALGNSNCNELLEFIEKPNAETAERLVQEQNIFWNAGIFFFKNAVIRSEFLKHSAGVFNDVARSVAMGKWQGTTFYPDADEFSKVNALSLDYAVMEKTEFASIAPLNSDWSDMGTWNTVWDVAEKNTDKNVVKGPSYMHDTARCYVQTDGPVVGVCGVEDIVVVANRDAVLVTSRENPQGVKKLVEKMKMEEASVIKHHSGEDKPWGRFDNLDKGETHLVKRIKVDKGEKLSSQYHFKSSKYWIVVKGIASVTINAEVSQLIPGQQIFISQGSVYCLENFSDEDVEIIEVQYGTYFGKDDIVSVEDNNHATSEKPAHKTVAA